MKLLKLLIVLHITAVIMSLSSCINCVEPTGEIKTQSRKLDDFTKIDMSIPGNIKIITGDSASIKITSCESYLNAITFEVRRDRLMLNGDICIADNDDVSIVITLPELCGISISGSANVFSETPIRTDELDIAVSGSGKVSLNVFTNSIICDIAGSGDINLNGTTKILDVDIEGSGSFKGLGLNSYKAYVEIAGSGNASVVALNKLEAKVAGSGEIKYSGEPELHIDITGSGKVNKIN